MISHQFRQLNPDINVSFNSYVIRLSNHMRMIAVQDLARLAPTPESSAGGWGRNTIIRWWRTTAKSSEIVDIIIVITQTGPLVLINPEVMRLLIGSRAVIISSHVGCLMWGNYLRYFRRPPPSMDDNDNHHQITNRATEGGRFPYSLIPSTRP